MTCPNCAAEIEQLPADRSVWCKRCGTHAELLTCGRLRRIRIPVLTQQSTPSERNGTGENIHPVGACQ